MRLEVVRLRDAKGGHSRLVLTDLGSTNGTWVNRWGACGGACGPSALLFFPPWLHGAWRNIQRRMPNSGPLNRCVAHTSACPLRPRHSRGRIEEHRPVTLRPGDVICLAEHDIAFEVAVAAPPPPAPAAAASNGSDAPAPEASAAHAQQAVATRPAVVAALRLAGALEAAAAEQGLFPPGGAVAADVPDRVRQLMADGAHDQAYVLLLAGVMQQPWAAGALGAVRRAASKRCYCVACCALSVRRRWHSQPGSSTPSRHVAHPCSPSIAPFLTGLWAQLANAERHRARLGCRPGSFGTARAFFAAAADAFAALAPSSAGGVLLTAAERAEGLSRVYSSWAQLELSLGHSDAARTLFRSGIAAARQHPAGAAAAGAPRQLVRWASLEWKAGEAAAAQRLCVEALELDPSNAHALTQLGTIEVGAAFLRTDFCVLRAGSCSSARFAAVAGTEHACTHFCARCPCGAWLSLLSAWLPWLQLCCAQAAARQWVPARRLFKRAVEVDPGHVAALQAWGRLEAAAGVCWQAAGCASVGCGPGSRWEPKPALLVREGSRHLHCHQVFASSLAFKGPHS